MKYIKLFIVTIVLLFLGIINCYAEENTNLTNTTPSIDPDQRIFDFANLYDTKEESKLNKKIRVFRDSTDIDSIIVTATKLDGKTISEYAGAFYEKNNFKSNAVVFVIYIKEIEPEIYMYGRGDKATKCYTDERIGEILEYVYKYVEKKEYYNATDKYMDIIQGFYNLDNKRDNYYLNDEGKLVKYIPWIEIVILSLTTTFIIIMVFFYRIKSNNKVNNSNTLDTKLDTERLVIKTLKDELIDTNISK